MADEKDVARDRKKISETKEETAIAYQNKDIALKILAERFKGKSFAVYGIDVPEIVGVLPTNLPAIEANELRLDNLFRLEDESYAIVDYESEYRESNKNKYIGYIARVIKRLYNELGYFPRLKLIIIYAADVKPGTTKPVLDIGCMRFELTEAFLVELDSNSIYDEIRKKINKKLALEDDDMMKLIIYPLTYVKENDKKSAIMRVVKLIDSIVNEEAQRFLYGSLLVFTDKVIDGKEAAMIREKLNMTKVGQIIANEIEAACEAERRKADERVDSVLTETAINMFKNGADFDMVKKCVNLPEARLKALQEQIQSENT